MFKCSSAYDEIPLEFREEWVHGTGRPPTYTEVHADQFPITQSLIGS